MPWKVLPAFQEEIEFKGDAEPQVQGFCLRGFSCRSGSCLKEGSWEGDCPEAKVLTHLMGLGSCFHTFSVWKNEWKQENWREEKKERKKETGPSIFILRGKVNKQEE